MVMGRQVPDGPKAYFAAGSVIDSKDVGLGYSQPDQSYVGVGYTVKIPWNEAAFDASKGFSIAQAPAFKMAEGMSLAFTADTKSFIRHDVGALRYYYNGAELFNVPDTGGFVVGGSINLQEANPVVFTSDAKSQLKHTANALRYYYNGAEIFNALDTGGFSINGSLNLSEANPVTFTSDGLSQLKHTGGALRYYYNGAEIVNFADAGNIATAAGVTVGGTLTYTYSHIPDNPQVPANTADPMGIVGDEIRSGPYLYRKTSSGWYRMTFSAF
jgi:hypothetical protein